MKIKHATQGGLFYPETKTEIIDLFAQFDDNIEPNYASRMIIVPHAGYVYSGKLAYNGYKFLDKSVKNVFIIAPAHYEHIFGCVISDYDEFETPLGNIEVNKEFSQEFANFCECDVNNLAFEKEHSIEVLLPFIKHFLPEAKIIPILYGCENFKNLTQSLEKFFDNKENAFIISSDLSHFYPQKDTGKIDNYTAQMIEANETRDFEIEQACGAVGICGALDFARNKNFTFIRLGLTNSGEITGDSSRVVGYGSWFLYEGEKNQYIKENYQEFLIKTARESIQSGLGLGVYKPQNYPCVFEENGASFVTLELDGELRGCIGSIIAHRPLIEDVFKNAHSAAFSDDRFAPLTLDEFSGIKIKISLLSSLQRVEFSSEYELLEKIRPYIDGLVIRDGEYQAVFLPVVWEMVPDKKEFLKELKHKAGMPDNYNTETMEAFFFQSLALG